MLVENVQVGVRRTETTVFETLNLKLIWVKHAQLSESYIRFLRASFIKYLEGYKRHTDWDTEPMKNYLFHSI